MAPQFVPPRLLRRRAAPELFEPRVAPATAAVVLVADRVLLVVVLVVVLSRVERARIVDPAKFLRPQIVAKAMDPPSFRQSKFQKMADVRNPITNSQVSAVFSFDSPVAATRQRDWFISRKLHMMFKELPGNNKP